MTYDAIYIDASGSMDGLFSEALLRVPCTTRPKYTFGTIVRPLVGSYEYMNLHYGGTKPQCVIRHAEQHDYKRILVITDTPVIESMMRAPRTNVTVEVI